MKASARKYIVSRQHSSCRAAFCLLVILLFGCARYQPLPLDPNTVYKQISPPDMETVRIQAKEIKHPLVMPIVIDLDKGISPEGAAVLAVLFNPALKVIRDQRGIAAAQLLQAGILPNPTFSFGMDFPIGGSTLGTVAAFGFALDWDIASLMTRGPKIDAARLEVASVELDIAWKEWQVAEAAKQHVYRIHFLDQEITLAAKEEKKLQENLESVKEAVARGDMTILDLDTANAAYQNVRTTTLEIDQQMEQERLELNSVLGFPPERILPIQKDITIPSYETLPSLEKIMDGLESRRLDLLALKMGYQSQEENLRASIRAQFPSISIGPTLLRDTGNVITTGFSLAISLPFFDHNQGQIALEKATRQQLFDEYMNRIFEARAQAASILANMRSLGKQIEEGEKTITSLKKLVQSSYTGYRAGNIDSTSYYDVVDRLFTKELEILKLKQELTDYGIALELTAGAYLEQLGGYGVSKR